LFYEEFDFDETEFRGCYYKDDLKIVYTPTLHAAGPDEWIDTIIHEWLHGLIDWAMEGDDQQYFKDKHDEKGNSDHFIMRLINYGN